MIKKELVNRSFSRAAHTYKHHALAQRGIVDRIASYFPKDNEVSSLLEIGCGSGFLTELLAEQFSTKSAIINDLSASWEMVLTPLLQRKGWQFAQGDAEQLTFSGAFDLIATTSTIQWMVQPAKFIERLYNMLAPAGTLLISTFGCDNFKQIKATTGHALPYKSIDELLQYLPKESIVEAFDEHIELTFASPLQLLNHLRKTGVNGLEKSPWSRAKLRQFTDDYQRQFTSENEVVLTYHPIYLVIKKVAGKEID